ncbi:MAG: hypothetical protein LBE22_09425 [Azoarcus sp.]|jgi:hypothetical protein|nr:hypothetical protein [Azoarcus sp.]
MLVDIHQHAREDIEFIRTENSKAAATILALLEQIEADRAVADKLTTHGDNFFGKQKVNVKQWESPGKKTNLWRLRVLDTPATSYRIVYGYQYKVYPYRIHILAVVKKGEDQEEFDYDTTSEKGRRIISDWKSLQA